jgi:hypothetical protein
MDKNPIFINTITILNNMSKLQNTISSQVLQYACVHLQIALGFSNLVEEKEEMVSRVTANSKFMDKFEQIAQ